MDVCDANKKGTSLPLLGEMYLSLLKALLGLLHEFEATRNVDFYIHHGALCCHSAR